ncbi:uncharacterized protein LOC109821776 [Asparagus officinalis]|uniref:uncharacterized protein LOC109821776 n=1 Tax=Asparagus officinalis TaxID=4686 RepID=UPI00098DEE77|nr:uncharacterized protein LOC109821776 [Asparagus officinalis]
MAEDDAEEHVDDVAVHGCEVDLEGTTMEGKVVEPVGSMEEGIDVGNIAEGKAIIEGEDGEDVAPQKNGEAEPPENKAAENSDREEVIVDNKVEDNVDKEEKNVDRDNIDKEVENVDRKSEKEEELVGGEGWNVDSRVGENVQKEAEIVYREEGHVGRESENVDSYAEAVANISHAELLILGSTEFIKNTELFVMSVLAE